VLLLQQAAARKHQLSLPHSPLTLSTLSCVWCRLPPTGGILLAVVIAAVVAATVLEFKAPGPETLQSVSIPLGTHSAVNPFWLDLLHCLLFVCSWQMAQ
jgi:hypothetical protein